MSDPVLNAIGVVAVLAVLYLVYICHLMHKRQERVEQYVMAAIRMGTVLAGGAAISPLMSFLQQPTARRARGS